MIQIENIVKTYAAGTTIIKAINNISLNFRENEFVSILGPSGCGKTTLLNILGGLDRYDSGDIKINDISTKNFTDKDWDAYRNHYIGFVFQNYNLISHLSVVENVELALSIGGIKKKEKRQLALNALSKVGLSEQAKKKPNQLSGGQMQRVAIARAIVNNPKIILADEPTGALDSETSVQVMDILKEISKDHLVVMVTHNKELADKYSSRIIKILDGKLIDDSNAFNFKEEVSKEEVKTNKSSKKTKVKKTKSAMSLFTAFALSFKNLFSKKAKTFLVSFAGSIGIIGIALVLAVSTGMTNYVNKMQSETLSGYPVTVSTVAIDYDGVTKVLSQNEEIKNEDNDQLNVYDLQQIMGKLGKYNYLSDEFVKYVNNYYEEDQKKPIQERDIASLKIEYATDLKLFTKVKGEIKQAVTTVTTSSLTGSSQSNFFQGLNNKDFVLENYEVVEGHYPTDKNELCLVIDSSGTFSKQTLDAMGFDYIVNQDGSFSGLSYSEIVGKEYKLILNDKYYIPNDNSNPTSFIPITIDENLYNNANLTLTISGIIKIKENASSEIYSSGIMYTPELVDFCKVTNRQSLIVQTSLQNSKMYVPFVVDVSEIKQFLGIPSSFLVYNTPEEILNYVKEYYNIDLSLDEALELSLQSLGASDIPTTLYLYSNTFDAKQNVSNYINAWNDTETGKDYPIVFTDSTAFLATTLGSLIDIISYILIAFAAISLIVSSIMIGIITYTSVVERTKEIGVLRSLGARKKDISRVFNMETFIIGLSAGLIGVLTAFGLSFVISAIIRSIAGSAVTTNLAILKLTDMLFLTIISVVLTLIAGIVPARIAAKKDPVKALRSE